jgi:hypothetical protein
LFEDQYPEFNDEQIAEAMRVMDEGYLAQNYYSKDKIKIRLEKGRQETYTYDDYGWTEHISRKWGQWYESHAEILSQLEKCGLDMGVSRKNEAEAKE